jgi:RNA polymerase primary sigma factor
MVGRELAIAVFDATLKEYLRDIDESALLTSEQEKQLGKRIIEENDPVAREQLVRSNLRLVVNIAKKFSNKGIGLADLIEEGNVGLIKAVDYFDPSKGTRFSTYAAWWIKQSIKRALLENVQPVHVPTYMVAMINQWRHFSEELRTRLGRDPYIEEMAEVMNLPVRKAKVISEVVKILGCVRDVHGSDTFEEDQVLEATLADDNTPSPDSDIESDEETAKVLSLLDEIDEREALILRLHYGLFDNEPMSLKDIGNKLGLTRERIRQILRGALTKLYEFMNESSA